MSIDPAHVEAVANVLQAAIDPSPRQRTGMSRNARERQARALLRANSPAVHAALLAALVRAGVLSEDRTEPYIQNRSTGPCEMYSGFGRAPSRTPGRRYVTRWEEVPT